MMQKEMSLRRRFLLILIACAVLPLVVVSMVSYHGLMAYDMILQQHIVKTSRILDASSQETRLKMQGHLSAMETELLDLSGKMRKILILSSLASITVIVIVGAFLVKTIAVEPLEKTPTQEYDATATDDFSNQMEELRKKLGNLVRDKDPDDS